MGIIIADSVKRIKGVINDGTDIYKIQTLPKILKISSNRVYRQDSYLLDSVLVFVKQLCEGHHSAHQNLMRTQPTANLIQLIIQLLHYLVLALVKLRGIVKQAQKDGECGQKKLGRTFDVIFETANLCLLTLLEMIQGPCIDNQLLIINSLF